RRVTLGAHQDQDIRHSEMWKSGNMEYGNLQSFLADVATVLHPLKGYQPNSLIRSIDCRLIARAGRDDGEDAAASGHDVLAAPRGAGVQDRDIRQAAGRIETVNHGSVLHQSRVSR